MTTLHGTELKLIDAMARRVDLAGRLRTSAADLAHLLATANPTARRRAPTSQGQPDSTTRTATCC